MKHMMEKQSMMQSSLLSNQRRSRKMEKVGLYRRAFPQWSEELLQGGEELHVVLGLIGHHSDVPVLHRKSINQSISQSTNASIMISET